LNDFAFESLGVRCLNLELKEKHETMIIVPGDKINFFFKKQNRPEST
jgi:hypothetical protein